jgi:hypothetical protein
MNFKKEKNVDVTTGSKQSEALRPPGRHFTCSRSVPTTHGTIPAVGPESKLTDTWFRLMYCLSNTS